MRLCLIVPTLLLAACELVPDPVQAPFRAEPGPVKTLEISNFIGQLEIEEHRSVNYLADLASMAQNVGDIIRVDGGASLRATRCDVRDDNIHIDDARDEGAHIVLGERFEPGRGNLHTFPVLKLQAPDRRIRLVIRDSIIFGETGDLAALDVNLGLCGRLDVGDAGDEARVALSGDSRVSLDDASSLAATVSGSAVLEAERIDVATLIAREQGVIRVQDGKNLSLTAEQSSMIELERAHRMNATLSQAARLDVESLAGMNIISQSAVSQSHIRGGLADSLELVASDQSTATIDAKIRTANLQSSGNARITVHEVRETLVSDARDQSEIFVSRDPDRLTDVELVKRRAAMVDAESGP